MSVTGETVTFNGIKCEVTDCICCGIPFAVPKLVIDTQRRAGGYHFCPNGHSQGWSETESEEAKTRRERDRLKQQIAAKDDEIARERQLREEAEKAAKSANKRTARLHHRANAGLCLCCNRHFSNLERHMTSKHKGEPAIQ